jgi:2'-5' RNA ligase
MTESDSIRAFVAFDLPTSVRSVIRREQEAIKAEMPKARWTRPEGQHVTLKFLGQTPKSRLDSLSAAIGDGVVGIGAVEVCLSGSGFFPGPRRPRVAWIGGEARGGREVAAAVENAAAAVGFDPDRRPWSLHLTQARLDRPWPRRAVETFLDWGRRLDIEPFVCRNVVLFRSDLRPGGAVYTALERYPLD